MNRQWTQFAAILMIVAMISFSLWPLWQWINIKTANAEMERQARAAYEKHPEFKPAWNIAMSDGVLTESEAKEILDAARERAEAAEKASGASSEATESAPGETETN